MMAAPLLLQQFARLPRPGQVKTRLQTELSAAEACAVHCELIEHVAGQLLAADLGAVELWLDSAGSHRAIRACLDAGACGPYLQQGTDLGARMEHALMAGLGRAGRVLLTGSDCPGLDRDYLLSAFRALDDCDVVFGPAEDGGYVLLGCRRMLPGLFRGVAWGGAEVLRQSEARLRARGWRWRRLAMRWDVDTPQDLRRWRDQAEAELRSGDRVGR